MRQPRRDTMLSERDALLEMAAWEGQLVRAYAAAIAETESRPLARELLALEGEQAETRLFLTEQLRADGYRVVDGPRTTGDGYYESCIEGPEGNLIEITA